MATIIAQPMPRVGRRMLVAAAVGVLLGGFAGGLVGRAFRSGGDATATGVSQAASSLSAYRGVITGTGPGLQQIAGLPRSAFSPEAIRAYVGSASTAAFSPEAIRAYVGSASTAAFSPEATRARNFAASSLLSAYSGHVTGTGPGLKQVAARSAFSPEAIRAQSYLAPALEERIDPGWLSACRAEGLCEP